MATQRKRHSAEFKAKVAVQAIQGEQTGNELASQHGVHPTQVAQWKRTLLEAAPGVFNGQKADSAREQEELMARLYQQIGQLQVELDWLKKSWELSTE